VAASFVLSTLLTPAPAAVAAADAAYRVNSGGPQLTGTPAWSKDQTGVNASPYVNAAATTDKIYSTTNPITLDASVPPGTPTALFQSERYDPAGGAEMQWDFPVAAGQYEVRLYFAETYSGTMKVGARKFDVKIEGALVLDNFDVYATYGANTGGVKSFVVASDATLDIDFFHEVENPAIKGIEIIAVEGANQLAAAPSSVEFGSVTVGSSASQTVSLKNLGASGDPTISISGASATGMFSASLTGSSSLAPGATSSLQVTFSPTSTGPKTGSVTVTHSGTNSPLTIPVSGEGVTSTPVSFGVSGLNGISLSNPTSLQFGPDDRLYVAEQSGAIKAYTIARNGPNDYQVIATETINLIKAMPNRNDNGTLNSSVTGRQVTGILVVGTATSPVIYVASSDPRIGGFGHGGDTNLDTNSGILSRLTKGGGSWSKVDLVRGLPRSEENHSPNGMQLDPVANILYLTVGGNTNMGAPSSNFALLPEFALSAAILAIDLDAIGETTYDLPTLDDPSRPGNPDANDPFGGNNGANQAKLVPGGPVKIHSAGWRNAYDVLIHSNGLMYSIDNGPNSGWGDIPINEGPGGTCTNDVNEPGVTHQDGLHAISGPGYYAGHPNPTRGNTNNQFNGQSPVTTANAVECDYRAPGSGNGALTLFGSSTNGIAEYTASNFGSALKGNLLAASFGGQVWRMQLNATGTALATPKEQLFSNFGSTPLDVTAQGDQKIFPGTIWAATYGSNSIVAFEPADYAGTPPTCTGADDATIDEDGDGYDNADEIDNGTDPCSAADRPPDWDSDNTSNLNDPDDDNDGIPDTSDKFAIDPSNGLTTGLPVRLEFTQSEVPGTLLDMGFTGLMTNLATDYEQLFDETKMTAGGAAGALTVDLVPEGDAKGTTNTQAYAFQLGLKPSALAAPFTVQARVMSPFAGLTPQNFQSMGVFIGTGDQDNYVKLVTAANGGGGGIEFAKEVSAGYSARTPASVPMGGSTPVDHVDLYLAVDPAAGTVQPSFAVTSGGSTGPVTTLGGPEPIPSGWLSGPSALAMGLISTSAGPGPEFPATWGFLRAEGGSQATSLYRVNAGGGQLSGDPVWSADTAASPSQYTNASAAGSKAYTSSATINVSDPSIPAGTPAALFQSERYDPSAGAEMTWAFPVTPGTYEVRLYFAETWFGAPGGGPGGAGKRVFDVSVEGQLVLNDYDIFADVGATKGVVKSFTVASDATLNIAFGHVVENPLIKGIEILGTDGGTAGTLTANPTSLSFGSITVGSTSTKSVTLTHAGPAGSSPIAIEGVSAGGDFSASLSGPSSLNPGDSSTVQVTFAPKSAGSKSGTLSVTHNGSNSPTAVSLSGEGAATAPIGSWETRAPSGPNRQEVSYVYVGGKFYLAGGGTAHEVYDPATNAWSTAAPLPQNLDHIQGVALNGLIYYIGGLSAWPGPAVSTVYIYNPATNAFTQGAPMQLARGAGGAAAHDGKIYYAGGLSGSKAVSWFDVYDPATNTWTQLPNMPRVRDHFHAVVHDGVFYAIGGRDTAIDATITAIDVYPLSAGAGGSWSTLSSTLPTARGGFAAAVLGEEILVIGGEGGGKAFATVEAFKPSTGAWRTLAPMPTARHGIQAAVCNGGVYIAAGGMTQGGGSPTDKHEVFFLDGATPCGDSTPPPPPPPSGSLFRVNAGGGQLSGDPVWSADTAASPSQYTNASAAGSKAYTSSATINVSDPSIPAGTPAALFQSERYDPSAGAEMTWAFPVTPGTYEVRLYFAETWFGAPGGGPGGAGKRVFDVSVEGQLVLNDYDIFADVGATKGVVKSFTVASDATLNIAFGRVVENPLIKGIEILGTDGGTAGTLTANPTSLSFGSIGAVGLLSMLLGLLVRNPAKRGVATSGWERRKRRAARPLSGEIERPGFRRRSPT